MWKPNPLTCLRSAFRAGHGDGAAVRKRREDVTTGELPGESAEATALVGEEYRQLLAVRELPPRQRETLVLRYYLDLSEEETARLMGIRRGTVKSATSRALAVLGQRLQEHS